MLLLLLMFFFIIYIIFIAVIIGIIIIATTTATHPYQVKVWVHVQNKRAASSKHCEGMPPHGSVIHSPSKGPALPVLRSPLHTQGKTGTSLNFRSLSPVGTTGSVGPSEVTHHDELHQLLAAIGSAEWDVPLLEFWAKDFQTWQWLTGIFRRTTILRFGANHECCIYFERVMVIMNLFIIFFCIGIMDWRFFLHEITRWNLGCRGSWIILKYFYCVTLSNASFTNNYT